MALEKPNSPAEREAKGIGGWLILSAISLVLGPLLILGDLVVAAILAWTTFYGATDTASALAGRSGLIVLPAIAAPLLLVTLVAVCYVAVIFFRKRSVAPRAYIGVTIMLIICCGSMAVFGLILDPHGLGLALAGIAAAALVQGLVWIPCFTWSERVKQTFVLPSTEQETRWVTYGTNVAVVLVLAGVVTVAAVWLSAAVLGDRARIDWSGGTTARLSPRTQALVAELPDNVTLTNLYSEEAPGAPNAADYSDMRRQVQELLQRYADVNPSHVTVQQIDPAVNRAGVEALLTRLSERYKGETAKPKALVEEGQALLDKTLALLDQEAKRLTQEADGWKGGNPDAVNALRTVAQRWSLMEDAGKEVAASVQDIQSQPIPDYLGTLDQLREYLKTADDGFAAVPSFYARILTEAKDTPPPASTLAILTSTKDTYGSWRTAYTEFAKKTADLKPLELDAIIKDLNQGQSRVILLESPTTVKVVSFNDVWPMNPAADMSSASASILKQRLFAGEQAVSSALMGLSKADRPALLFVTFGATATGYGGPFAELGSHLRLMNFIVDDWDLTRKREMPHPEHASKIILVFTPPPPPNPRMPTPPVTADMYQPALDAVKAGAPALVLGEPGGFMGPTVPYAELYPLFGVTPKFNAEAVHKILVDSNTGEQRAIMQLDLAKYNDHPITQPLGGMPCLFVAACPLEIMKAPPAGVTAQSILDLPKSPNYWADTNVISVMQGDAKRDDAEDLAGPLPLAVAATRPSGNAEQRAVLFGGHFAEDQITQHTIQGQPMFPGSMELFVNSAMWVAGESQLLEISPQALQARRLNVTDSGWWLRLVIIGALPLAALIMGLIMYIIRRR